MADQGTSTQIGALAVPPRGKNFSGMVQISVYGPPGQLRQALAANGFTVRPAVVEGTEQLVIATKN